MKTRLFALSLLALLLAVIPRLSVQPAAAQPLPAGPTTMFAPGGKAAAGLPRSQAAAVPASLPPGWEYACADCPYSSYLNNDHNLRLDSRGRLHLAFGRYHMYYAVFDGSAWQVEMVDKPELTRGVASSLALDADDNPHILYREMWTWDIYYAHKDAAGWHIELLHESDYPPDDEPKAGLTTIEFDAQNRPHALFRAYISAAVQPLVHAWREGGTWHFETLDDTGVMGFQSALAFDSQGYMHITYSDHSTQYLASIYYAYQDASGWHKEILQDGIEDQAAYGGRSSLALTDAGLPVVAYYYYDGTQSSARVAFRQSNGTWVKEDAYVHVSSYPTMLLDAAGYPHLLFAGSINGYTESATHAYKDGLGWHAEQIEAENYNLYEGTLVRNANGDLYTYYWDMYHERLNYASLEAGSSAWTVNMLAPTGNSGVENMLVLDAADQPHLANVDQYSHDGQPRYSYWDGAAWQTEVVQERGYEGYFGQPNPALALDADQNVHLSFYNTTGLAYGYRDALGWHTENVPGVGVADHSSAALAIGADGYPRIAHSLDNKKLAYSYLDAGGWHTDMLTTTGAAAVDMVLDANGYAHISYVKSGLRYAYQDSTGWHFEKVNTPLANAAAYATSLALDAEGRPHIASGSTQLPDYSYPIVYSYKEAGTWISYEVEHHGGAYPALALDSHGYPHVAYQTGRGGAYPNYTSDVRYAYQDESGWHYQTLLTVIPGRVHFPFVDIALDSQDRPYISFTHYNALALMSRTAPVDTEPPTLPNDPGTGSPLITPTLGVTVGTHRPFFDWTDGEDNVGVVSYTLVITGEGAGALSSAVAAVYRVTTVESEYTPTWDLPNGAYAWTVRAYDAAGNASDWVAPQHFTVAADYRVYLPLVARNW